MVKEGVLRKGCVLVVKRGKKVHRPKLLSCVPRPVP